MPVPARSISTVKATMAQSAPNVETSK